MHLVLVHLYMCALVHLSICAPQNSPKFTPTKPLFHAHSHPTNSGGGGAGSGSHAGAGADDPSDPSDEVEEDSNVRAAVSRKLAKLDAHDRQSLQGNIRKLQAVQFREATKLASMQDQIENREGDDMRQVLEYAKQNMLEAQGVKEERKQVEHMLRAVLGKFVCCVCSKSGVRKWYCGRTK